MILKRDDIKRQRFLRADNSRMINDKVIHMYSKTWHRQLHNFLLFILPAVVIYTIFWVVPILFNLLVSFTKWNGMTKFIDVKWAGLHNYILMLSDNIFLTSFAHNLEFTALGVVFIPAFSLIIALMVEKGVRKKGFFRTSLFIPAVLPMLLVSILFRWVFSIDNGMINAFLGVIGLKSLQTDFLGNSNTALLSLFVINLWKSVPFYMTIILAGLQSVPRELEEAAMIDGCNKPKSFWYITIPMLRPILVVVYGLVLIDGFRIFDLVFVTTKGGPNNSTMVMATYNYLLAFSDFRVGYATALSTFNVLIVLIISIIYFRLSMKQQGLKG